MSTTDTRWSRSAYRLDAAYFSKQQQDLVDMAKTTSTQFNFNNHWEQKENCNTLNNVNHCCLCWTFSILHTSSVDGLNRILTPIYKTLSSLQFLLNGIAVSVRLVVRSWTSMRANRDFAYESHGRDNHQKLHSCRWNDGHMCVSGPMPSPGRLCG